WIRRRREEWRATVAAKQEAKAQKRRLAIAATIALVIGLIIVSGLLVVAYKKGREAEAALQDRESAVSQAIEEKIQTQLKNEPPNFVGAALLDRKAKDMM